MRVLNVAEKPSVAKEIAGILSAGRAQRVRRLSLSVDWLPAADAHRCSARASPSTTPSSSSRTSCRAKACRWRSRPSRATSWSSTLTPATGAERPIAIAIAIATARADRLDARRSWHSCDPVELFDAPVAKKVRSDETQKLIEKTLLSEARNSQVRPLQPMRGALGATSSCCRRGSVARSVARLRPRGREHCVRSQRCVRARESADARVPSALLGADPSRHCPRRAEPGDSRRKAVTRV